MSDDWITTIGLEIHVQLQTRTKMFCGCPNRYGADPNTLVCPVCLGLPGTLPVINKKAYRMAIRTALALNCTVHPDTRMDRKNYYYPDLPKNYQISQYDRPFSTDGSLSFTLPDGESRTVTIRRVHMEEDAGKLIHAEPDDGPPRSRVDLNRAGVPLLEIVTEPDMTAPVEAYRFLKELKNLLEYLRVSDCDMEKGRLRCDSNISLRRRGEEQGTKVEVKNLNSFKNVRSALEHEEKRQKRQLENGDGVEQGTVQFDAERDRTIPMRMKEEESDYRYFPEPDLPPLAPAEELIREIEDDLPERPSDRRERFREDLGLSDEDARMLTRDRAMANYFERALETYDAPKAVANWIMSDVREHLNEHDQEIDAFPIEPSRLAELARLFEEDRVTSNASSTIFDRMLDTDDDPETILEREDLGKMGDKDQLESLAAEVIEENEQPVQDYLDGNDNAIQALMGQIMSRTQGKADPQTAMETLRDQLDDLDG